MSVVRQPKINLLYTTEYTDIVLRWIVSNDECNGDNEVCIVAQRVSPSSPHP